MTMWHMLINKNLLTMGVHIFVVPMTNCHTINLAMWKKSGTFRVVSGRECLVPNEETTEHGVPFWSLTILYYKDNAFPWHKQITEDISTNNLHHPAGGYANDIAYRGQQGVLITPYEPPYGSLAAAPCPPPARRIPPYQPLLGGSKGGTVL